MRKRLGTRQIRYTYYNEQQKCLSSVSERGLHSAQRPCKCILGSSIVCDVPVVGAGFFLPPLTNFAVGGREGLYNNGIWRLSFFCPVPSHFLKGSHSTPLLPRSPLFPFRPLYQPRKRNQHSKPTRPKKIMNSMHGKQEPPKLLRSW